MPPNAPRRYDTRAAIEAASFLLVGILALVTAALYSGKSIGNREALLLVLTFVASGIVYYIRLPVSSIGRKQPIDDLLSLAGVTLGPTYRLNIMRLRHHRDEAQRTFGFVSHFNMQDLHRYEGLLRLNTPGVGEAYMHRKVIHLDPNKVNSSVDSYPKHIWSVNIESPRCPRCVLNIDTNLSQLVPDQIEHVERVITLLAKLVAKRNPAQLPFLE